MQRTWNILGVITGGLLIASSAAHSFLGWKAMQEQLQAIGAAPDLVTGLAIGWQFAGASILLFGIIVGWTFITRLRGMYAPVWPAKLIGAAYGAFGIAAYAISKNTFFLAVFVAPAILITLASMRSEAELAA